MKKILIIGLSIIIAMASSCKKDDVKEKIVEAQEVQLTPDKISIVEGNKLQIQSTVIPEETKDKSLTWISSNNKIVSVDSKGEIIAISPGEVTVTATTSNNISTECEIHVYAKPILVQSIKLSFTEFALYEGNTKQISAAILPENASDKSIVWTSSNDKIAIINEEGLITAISPGNVKIIANSGDGNIQSICEGKIIETVDVTDINFIYPCTELYVGNKKYIVRDILPKNASNQNLVWTSSDNKIATVDWDGVVSALSKGLVTITATAHNGVKQSTDIEIKEVVVDSGFRISPTITACSLESQYVHIYVSISHFNEAEKDMKITWECSDDSKVKLEYNSNPVFAKPYPYLTLTDKALDKDQVTVIATREDGKTSTCLVTVNREENYKRVTSVTGLPDMEMKIGEEDEFWCNVSPYTATNSEMIYFNSNESIASISVDGNVKALKEGECIITAWSVDCGRFVKTIIKVSK